MICTLAGLGVLALLAALLSGAGYEVRGDAAMPYESGTVKEVRVLGSFTVYVDAESQPTPGILGGLALLMLATAAFMTALVLRMVGARGRLVAFYALICAGFGFAAFDELFAMHETLGHNLQFLADIPGVTRPDDVVVALYILPAVAFVYFFRDVVIEQPPGGFRAGGCTWLLRAVRCRRHHRPDQVRGSHGGVQRPVHHRLPSADDALAPARQPAPAAVAAPDEVTVVDQRPQPRVPAGTAG